jgi:PhoH-like ATPase
VVLPVVVITELEGKRNHPELGWAARTSLRHLEQLRLTHGVLHRPIPVNDEGGTVRVELNHLDASGVPASLRGESNDHRILAVATALAREGTAVTLVSKDLPLRLKAALAGLDADDYHPDHRVAETWTGMVEVHEDPDVIDHLYRERVVEHELARSLPCHAGVVLVNGSQSALGRVHPDKRLHLVEADRALLDVRGRSAEQRVAVDLLADPSIGIVSIGGRAGTGKSVLALAAGLEAVLEARTHRQVIVFRPLFAVGGQQLGYLPGGQSEKMDPWGAAVTDALSSIADRNLVEEVLRRNLIEVLPLTHIRGRTLTDTFVVIDEAQNLERPVLLAALSRLGRNSRVVLTHDVSQRDNLRVSRHDGIATVIDDLSGHPLFAHVTLTRSERSPVAALVASLLEDPTA